MPSSLLQLALNPSFYGNPKKQEYAVMTLEDGSKRVKWGTRDRVDDLQLDGVTEVSHNHPGGSPLSFVDLQLLSRIGRIEAIGKKRSAASKGPHYSDLQKAYVNIYRSLPGPTDLSAINGELAKRGVITYSEDPLEAALLSRQIRK